LSHSTTCATHFAPLPGDSQKIISALYFCYYSNEDFSENDFSGTLPTNAIAKLLDLQKFHVKQSGKLGPGITGKLPSFKEQKLLHMLDLNSNSMTGSIPSDFLSGVTNVDQLMAIE
jgi:hypothetical protein